ncbi:MAG: hypothetical protein Kow0032_04160 [Methyloligellaceae bacterium]
MGFRGKDESVSKGPVVRALEEISRGKDAKARLEALRAGILAAAEKDFAGLGEVFRENLLRHWSAVDAKGPDLINRMAAYLAQNWFSEELNDFGHKTAEIYARGILSAIDASLRGGDPPLPIDSVWIVNHERVEMVVLERPDLILLLILTPETDDKRYEGEDPRAACDAWVTTESTKRYALEVDALKLDPAAARRNAAIEHDLRRDADGIPLPIPRRVATYKITGATKPE